MITVLDTNVLVYLWDEDPEVNLPARKALDQALEAGALWIPAPVFAELMAFPGRSDNFLRTFLRNASISIDWHLPESVWTLAGSTFAAYVKRRRRSGGTMTRRLLTDFLIGAYAHHHGYRLLTFDRGIYAASFPKLKLTRPI